MKRLFITGALLALSTVPSFALLNCTSGSTGLVSDLITNGGCIAVGLGFNFTNFSVIFDPAAQASYFGTPVYSTDTQTAGTGNSGANTRYTFNGTSLSSFGFTFAPDPGTGPGQFPGGVWKVTTNVEQANAFSNLNFKVVYFIDDTTSSVNRINAMSMTQTNLTAPAGVDYGTTQSVATKFVQQVAAGPPTNPIISTAVATINTAGPNQNKTSSNTFSPSGASLRITDNIALTLSDNNNVPFTATMSLGSFSNTFSVQAIPEPVSLALMGSGLVGIALLRRRARKS